MKVTLERAALLKSLGHVHRVVERRNTIPILSNVLLHAEDQALLLKATDLDLEVTERLPADVGEAGATTLPAHILYEIVRKLPDGAQVSLDSNGGQGQLQLRSGRSRFTLQSLPESDFPDLATGELGHGFTLAALDLKRLIDKTQFAISNEETRYYLNGVYLHTIDVEAHTMLRAVATDGHRLARVEIPAPKGAIGMPGVILPRKAVAEVQKLIEDPSTDVRVEISAAKARFTFGDPNTGAGQVVLISKLIDGTFPDYVRVIPSNNDKRLVVEREPFAAAVDRVSTISSERGRAVKLALADSKLTLSVTNPDSGSAVEELDVDYDSSPIDIGFNARYLLDITEQLDSDTVLFKLADPGSPTLVQDRDGASALYVLMPMRV
ncbi:MAG TPA: DNA polymerase III subunit beta [Methylocella sp.]|nr:DNA polymerase III subunit beta [Methylocella sp.]